ncbi:hypothetical protein [Puerhibacterium sp. TATVAM-FAB25]|uniref:hypothetical protein n=1 Tax=Puerhibacterium sp. TATVAM-FAB25 TaxID=3093699 RepID=UPI00397914B9
MTDPAAVVDGRAALRLTPGRRAVTLREGELVADETPAWADAAPILRRAHG